MNKLIILGRTVADPEVRYTESGKIVCNFTLAVDRPFSQNGERDTDFIPCVMWGKSAETIGNNVRKGQRLLVEGRLQIRGYDAKDGSKRYVAECVGSNFEFIEKKGQSAPMGQEVKLDEEIPF